MNTANATLTPQSAAIAIAPGFILSFPETTLRCGYVVAAFRCAQHMASKGEDGSIVISASAKPWTDISYFDAAKKCDSSGLPILRLSQSLAIAQLIASVDENWTGGKVGEGKVFQGLHKGTVDEAQASDYVSDDPEERSYHVLPWGDRIYGFVGNICSWLFDDIQGDARGLIAKAFAADSPTITTAPYPSMEKGMGWQPKAETNGPGSALIRGGHWDDGGYAGLFDLDSCYPGNAYDDIGFRCTFPE